MTDKKHLDFIKNNYNTMEQEIVNQLTYKCGHPTTQGSNREEVWKSMFERIIPQKFNIERSVFIVDSKGNISNEVDLAIYDEQYTPYIFRYGLIKFIPVEAVAAVIECKSSNPDKDSLKKWCDSIDNLETGNDVVVRMASNIVFDTLNPTQERTNPIKILCHMGVSEYKQCNFDIMIKGPKEPCNKNNESGNSDTETNELKKLDIQFNEKYKNLLDWYIRCNFYEKGFYDKDCKDLNHFKNPEKIISIDKDQKLSKKKLEDYSVKNNVILSFVFQFNQILMLINNPIFFPHMDYVNMFNCLSKGSIETEKEK